MPAHPRAPGGPGKRLIDDPRFRTELELCDRWGIPHSLFLGAGDGRWSARDREKALAYQEFMRSVCGECGTRAQEWDPKAGGDRHAYVATDFRCPGCESIAQLQKQIPETALGVKVGLLPQALARQLAAELDD